MPNERIYIEDLSGNTIVDQRSLTALDYATNITFSSRIDRGYDECGFRIRVSDVLTPTAIKSSYSVAIYDGLNEVWYGRLRGPTIVIQGGDEYIQCQAVGWAVRLNEVHIRKKWLDDTPILHSRWPDDATTSNYQLDWVENLGDSWYHVKAATADLSRGSSDIHRLLYEAFATIDRVTFDYYLRTGEGFDIEIYNIDQTSTDYDSGTITSAGGTSGSVDDTLGDGATTSIEFRIRCAA